MTLRATRTIGTGDGWDLTDNGIYVPDWTGLEDVRPGAIIENPHRQPIGIDLFAGAGGFSCGFKQAGWHVVAANEWDVEAAHTYLCNLGSPQTRIAFCAPEDEQRWTRTRKRLERYHSQPARPSLEPGSGWIAGQTGVRPCEVLFFGDVRALTGQRMLDELGLTGEDVGCVFGGPPCQGFSRAGKRQQEDPRNELVFEFMRVVCEIHPRSFCMENVPGMLDMVTREGVPVIDALALMAQEGGMGDPPLPRRDRRRGRRAADHASHRVTPAAATRRLGQRPRRRGGRPAPALRRGELMSAAAMNENRQQAWERTVPTWTCDCAAAFKVLPGGNIGRPDDRFHRPLDDGRLGALVGTTRGVGITRNKASRLRTRLRHDHQKTQ